MSRGPSHKEIGRWSNPESLDAGLGILQLPRGRRLTREGRGRERLVAPLVGGFDARSIAERESLRKSFRG